MITFFVPGAPVPQPRPRVYQGRAVSNTAKVSAFKDAIRALASVELGKLAAKDTLKPGSRLKLPLHVHLAFRMPRPKSLKGGKQWHTVRPDADNLAKAVLDALNGTLFTDDAQVCSLHVCKLYCAPGGSVGVSVTVQPAGEI